MLENQARVLILPTSSSYSSFEDEKSSETKPFLSKVLSFDNTIIPTSSSSSSSSSSTRSSVTSNNYSNNKKRRRRSPSEASLPQEQSLVEEMEHAASEAFFISRLSIKLFTYLGLGYRWIIRFLALGCYSVLIMPGLLQVAYYYYKSNLIRRGIPYGDQPRNRLDLYIPVNNDGLKPVVAFVTGGAWIIGYKAWGALLGLQLAERDIIVACIDYRNFPQATIGDMVTDASQGISFLCNNIAEYGGDPNRIYLMGQSAGAHIAACTLVKQASKEFVEGGNCSWTVTQLKAYFGLSGGYNLHDLVPHFHNRGLYRSVFLRIMEGEHSLQFFSPELMIQDPSMERAVLHLPPIILFHGTGDYSIPSDSSKKFADCLQRLGARAELILYKEKTHTDLFVQDPLRGGTDDLVRDVASFIHAGDPVALAKDTVIPPRRRLVPEFLLKLATKISPF